AMVNGREAIAGFTPALDVAYDAGIDPLHVAQQRLPRSARNAVSNEHSRKDDTLSAADIDALRSEIALAREALRGAAKGPNAKLAQKATNALELVDKVFEHMDHVKPGSSLSQLRDELNGQGIRFDKNLMHNIRGNDAIDSIAGLAQLA